MRFLKHTLLAFVLVNFTSVAIGDDNDAFDESARTLVIRYDPEGVQLTDRMLRLTLNRPGFVSEFQNEKTSDIVKSVVVDLGRDSQSPGIFSPYVKVELVEKVDRQKFNSLWKSLASKLEDTLNERLYERPRDILDVRRVRASARLSRYEDELTELERRFEEHSMKFGSLEELQKKSAELSNRYRELELEQMIGKKRAELEKSQLAALQKKLQEQQAKAKELMGQQAKLEQALVNDPTNAVELSAGRLSSTQQLLLETRQSVLRQLEAKSTRHDELELARALVAHESSFLGDYLEEWKKDALQAKRELTNVKRRIGIIEKQRELYEDLVILLTLQRDRIPKVTVELWD